MSNGLAVILLTLAPLGIVLLIISLTDGTTLSERKHRRALCEILAQEVIEGTLPLDRYLAADCRAKNIPLIGDR